MVIFFLREDLSHRIKFYLNQNEIYCMKNGKILVSAKFRAQWFGVPIHIPL